MTLVNFYTLHQETPEAELVFACRLTEKARELGHRVYIQTKTPAQAKRLDDLLWQFKPASFIPHSVIDDPATSDSAVAISTQPAAPTFQDLLINLSASVCSNIEQFARIHEIIAADTDSIEAGRIRYRAYREAGATLQTIKI